MQSLVSLAKRCALCGKEIGEDEGVFVIRANHEATPTIVCFDCTLRENDLFRVDWFSQRV
jgi:hypothetical protein